MLGKSIASSQHGLLGAPTEPVVDALSTNPNIGAAARLQFIAAVIRSFLLFMFQWIVARAFGAGPFGIMNLTLSGFQSATALGRAAGDNIVLRSHEGSERGTAFAVGVTISLVAGTLAAVGLWGWGLWLANGRFLSEVSVCFLHLLLR